MDRKSRGQSGYHIRQGTFRSTRFILMFTFKLYLVALLAYPGLGNPDVAIPLNFKKFGKLVKMPDFAHLYLDAPNVLGVISLTDAELSGFDDTVMHPTYDPMTNTMNINMTAPSFRLKGNYTANLAVFDSYGDNKVLDGSGHFDIRYTNVVALDGNYKLKYNPNRKRYYFDEPHYEAKVKSIRGRINGLKVLVQSHDDPAGTEIELGEAVELLGSLHQPVFLELYRAICNHQMRRGYARGFGSGFLLSFFNQEYYFP